MAQTGPRRKLIPCGSTLSDNAAFPVEHKLRGVTDSHGIGEAAKAARGPSPCANLESALRGY
jgi:hypothetical protein